MRDRLSAPDVGSAIATAHRPGHLPIVWHRAMAAAYPERFERPMTKAEQGRLSLLARAVGGVPKAAVLIAFVIQNWDEFATIAKIEAGLKQVPSMPKVGFLLRNVDAAVNLKDAETTQSTAAELMDDSW